MIGLVADALIVGLIVLGAYLGKKKGLIKMFLSAIAPVLSAILAFTSHTVIARRVYYDMGVRNWVEGNISLGVSNSGVGKSFAKLEDLEKAISEIASQFGNFQNLIEDATKVNIPSLFDNKLVVTVDDITLFIMKQVDSIALNAVNSICFFALFILLWGVFGIIFSLISSLLRGVVVVGATDKILGAIIGGICATVVLFIAVYMLLSFDVATGDLWSDFFHILSESYFSDLIRSIT